MEIGNKVIEEIKEQLCVSVVELKDKIVKDLEADSLDIVELMMNLENEFDIEIEDDDFVKLSTVEDIVKFIKGKTK